MLYCTICGMPHHTRDIIYVYICATNVARGNNTQHLFWLRSLFMACNEAANRAADSVVYLIVLQFPTRIIVVKRSRGLWWVVWGWVFVSARAVTRDKRGMMCVAWAPHIRCRTMYHYIRAYARGCASRAANSKMYSSCWMRSAPWDYWQYMQLSIPIYTSILVTNAQ